MTTLTRAQAKATLLQAGWPLEYLDTMVAVAAQESSLRIEVVGPRNDDGTEDLGWCQVNSRYTVEGPHPAGAQPGTFSRARLLSEPTYNAKCARSIFNSQGLGAWVAYTSGAHLKFMPAHLGGPTMTTGCPAWFLVVELQQAVNAAMPPGAVKLVADGIFGPKTKNALINWQKANPPPADGTARPADTVRLL